MQNESAELTLAELSAAVLVSMPAALILTAYLVDLAGWPIDPGGMLVLLALEFAALGWAWRRQGQPVRIACGELIGFVIVVVGVGAHLLWLAWPSWLPIAFPYDLTHHLTLIEFIQQHHSLAHDPALQPYLEVNYTPGSHILAALTAAWFNTVGLYVVHPIVAILAAIKAGVIYNISLRIQTPTHRNPALALAGTAFLLVVPGYFEQSFTVYGFYAQIVSELFIIAMLWALMVSDTRPALAHMLFFALCGSAMVLVWPLWLPIPLLVLMALLLRRSTSLRARIQHAAFAIAPIVFVAALYTLSRTRYASEVLLIGGGVIKPWVDVFGELFLVLFVLGLIVSGRQQRMAPILLFAAATFAQTVGLFIFAVVEHERTFYLAFKMFYLIFYVMLLCAAFALDDLWRVIEQALPARWRARWSRLAAALPALVLLLALQRGVLTQPPALSITSIYDAGRWAKSHLSAGCVDYLVGANTEYYWLHIAVLGNPRETPRVAAMLRDEQLARTSANYWTDASHLPFAIMPDLRAMPTDLRANFTVLYEAGTAAVVQRNGAPTCRDESVPLHRVVVAPRGWTLAGWLASLRPK